MARSDSKGSYALDDGSQDDFDKVAQDLKKRKLKLKAKQAAGSWLFHAGVGVFIWLLVGVVTFRWASQDPAGEHWPTSAAFYFASQAGLSVGFGVSTFNLGEASTPRGLRFFCTLFVLVGSSFIAGALAIFIEGVMAKQGDYYEDEMRALNERQNKKDTRTAAAVKIDDAIQFAKDHATAFVSMTMFIVWIIAGILFGMYSDAEMDFETALLFAVTALSTGGLIGPATDTFSLWFTGLYVLTGVPLYAFVLGQVAGIFIERQARQEFKAQLQKKITQEEFEYAAKLMKNEVRDKDGNVILQDDDEDDGEIDLSEFIIMSLLRMGKIDQGQLERIKQRFRMLDIDGNARFTRTEMRVALCFDKWDADGSGELDEKEFCGLCADLGQELGIQQLVTNIDDVRKVFEEIDQDSDSGGRGAGTVSRKEFFEWWEAFTKGLPQKQKVRNNAALDVRLEEDDAPGEHIPLTSFAPAPPQEQGDPFHTAL